MQILVNGFIAGLAVAVLALAFTVVYLPTRVFHVALGGVYAAVPFVVWAFLRSGCPWWLAVLAATATGIALSLACEAVNHAPLERRKASPGVHLVSSLGIYTVLVQVVALIWGNETKVFRTGLDSAATIGGVIVTRAQILSALVSVVMLALFYLWLHGASLGLQFRALADNPVEIALRGYNVRRLRLLAFGMSGALCSASTLLFSYDLGFDPQSGLPAVILAVVGVIIGGRQSFLGPIFGGLLLGVVRSEIVWLLSARWQEAVTFLLLALFLFARPEGIIGRARRLEAIV